MNVKKKPIISEYNKFNIIILINNSNTIEGCKKNNKNIKYMKSR